MWCSAFLQEVVSFRQLCLKDKERLSVVLENQVSTNSWQLIWKDIKIFKEDCGGRVGGRKGGTLLCNQHTLIVVWSSRKQNESLAWIQLYSWSHLHSPSSLCWVRQIEEPIRRHGLFLREVILFLQVSRDITHKNSFCILSCRESPSLDTGWSSLKSANDPLNMKCSGRVICFFKLIHADILLVLEGFQASGSVM